MCNHIIDASPSADVFLFKFDGPPLLVSGCVAWPIGFPLPPPPPPTLEDGHQFIIFLFLSVPAKQQQSDSSKRTMFHFVLCTYALHTHSNEFLVAAFLSSSSSSSSSSFYFFPVC